MVERRINKKVATNGLSLQNIHDAQGGQEWWLGENLPYSLCPQAPYTGIFSVSWKYMFNRGINNSTPELVLFQILYTLIYTPAYTPLLNALK